MQKLKEKITNTLSLPKEIALNLPVVTATGRREVIIENYKNLIEFADTVIRVRTADSTVTIEGEHLALQHLTTENVMIVGRIACILFE